MDRGLHTIGMGSGFFVRNDARLLTNKHVVEKCAAVSVETADGNEALATVLAIAPESDLALIKVDAAAPAVATFREKVRMDGHRAVVIGYPSHGLPRIKPTLVPAALMGPVSMDGQRFVLQGDIRPGNSGGPVLDESGLVVGVVFGKINTVAVYQNTGRNVEDIGFAITNETALTFLAHNGITVATATNGPKLDDDTLFEDGRKFIARVVCWH
ncbi:serine protease [Telmatospirillum sp.]|uniref:S1C family serine protease n=1 Tax=Telmatospirillum sp. TaxID=2079197 RepID=UPI00284C2A71|nr:serine protease [Telmatospirillum sp.]MDR3439955.1 serine protease [Telmatospirillum sp.]